MIGIDTNILVRYITQDDLKQAEKAAELIENKCSEKHPAYVNLMVLCELIWVLSFAYGYERSMLVPVLKQILMTESIEVDNSPLAWLALYDYEIGPADFSDYLIAHLNKSKEVEYTATFDKKAAKHKFFELI